ncbi:MAG: hypothetical protein QOJ52_4456 [Acidimicrobiaceae bacterium]|nr:hypothetical protein [Acidimicrobiaceae bacterium]
MRDNQIVEAEVFSARTHLASELGDARGVDARLDGLRTRWNQFGVATLIRAQDAQPRGVLVRYRLTVDGHRDPQAVHTAFRGDLDRALARPAAPPAPVSWDLAAMAQAATEADDTTVAPVCVYIEDGGYDWSD